jgi:hypothetical protein
VAPPPSAVGFALPITRDVGDLLPPPPPGASQIGVDLSDFIPSSSQIGVGLRPFGVGFSGELLIASC